MKQKTSTNSLIYSQNNLKTNKNNISNSVTNNLNLNIYPISRDNKSYIKKNSSNTNLNNKKNNENINLVSNTFRSSAFKHKKNNSISLCNFNTKRNNKDNKLNLQEKDNKNNIYYSPNNRIGKSLNHNSVIVQEYTLKLESIKSRVSNLLNIYSLLALRSMNDTNNIIQNKEVDNNDNNH